MPDYAKGVRHRSAQGRQGATCTLRGPYLGPGRPYGGPGYYADGVPPWVPTALGYTLPTHRRPDPLVGTGTAVGDGCQGGLQGCIWPYQAVYRAISGCI